MMKTIYFGDNLSALANIPDASIRLIYIDPPFNTGNTRKYTRTKMHENINGTREGFGGKRYDVTNESIMSFDDSFDDYMSFLRPRLLESKRVLTDDGSLFFHIDPRESHYCKILLDQIFGRSSFINEIIWSYDFGGRSKKRWPRKHDTIFWYAKNPDDYVYHLQDVDRIPYRAPSLVTAEKVARGKSPTDVWWMTIVHTNGRERTGYPTQKPRGLLERIIRTHSDVGDIVLDFFAGSGTTGAAAYRLDRSFILADNNPHAINTMHERFHHINPDLIDLTTSH